MTLYNPDRTVRFSAQPFGAAYKKGIRVAVGDVTGDGVPDVVVATSGGVKGKVKIIDGSTGTLLSNQLLGAIPYTGPISIAVGDVTGDGVADIAVGTNQGGARVRVFNGGDFAKLTVFSVGPAAGFKGGTTVALGDVTGDGQADLIVTSRRVGRSRVDGFDGTSLAPGVAPAAAFTKFTLAGEYVSGFFLAVGDVNADGHADLVLGSAATRSPHVVVYSGQSLVEDGVRSTIADFVPAEARAKSGVRVGVRDVDGDGIADVLTSSGEMVSAFKGRSDLLATTGLPLLFSFDPYPNVNGGVWIG